MASASGLLNSFVPITNFNRGQSSRIFERLQSENQLIVLKNNQPAAVILSPKEYSRLSEIEEDYVLLLEALKRLQKSDGKTVSFEDVLKELGLKESDLEGFEDVEIE